MCEKDFIMAYTTGKYKNYDIVMTLEGMIIQLTKFGGRLAKKVLEYDPESIEVTEWCDLLADLRRDEIWDKRTRENLMKEKPSQYLTTEDSNSDSTTES